MREFYIFLCSSEKRWGNYNDSPRAKRRRLRIGRFKRTFPSPCWKITSLRIESEFSSCSVWVSPAEAAAASLPKKNSLQVKWKLFFFTVKFDKLFLFRWASSFAFFVESAADPGRSTSMPTGSTVPHWAASTRSNGHRTASTASQGAKSGRKAEFG